MGRYALLATIDRYANEGLTPLKFANRDGMVLEALLQERGFKTLHLAGPNATRDRILKAIWGRDAQASWPPFTAEDLLLFFFAGHGELVGGNYVLHGYGAEPGSSIDSVAMHDVAHALKIQIPCRQCACIIDACRNLARPGARGSAALDAESSRDIKAVASTASTDVKLVEIVYGCEEGQVSMEDPTLQHGVLTYHIAQVIREDTCETLHELCDLAADRMGAWSQKPHHYRPSGTRRIRLFDHDQRRLIEEKKRAEKERAEQMAAEERETANRLSEERAKAERAARELAKQKEAEERAKAEREAALRRRRIADLLARVRASDNPAKAADIIALLDEVLTLEPGHAEALTLKDHQSARLARETAERNKQRSGARTIGIDLGSTNSVVAVMEGDRPNVIPNSRGGRRTPSVVAFTDNGEVLVGQAAKNQQSINPRTTIFSIKRFMGRRRKEVASEELNAPYEVVGGDNDFVKIRVRSSEYTPERILGHILQYLKKTAEDYLDGEVTQAVITVPAFFNDVQRKAIRDAGKIAGLNVLRVLHEPSAAALAYGFDKKKNEKIFVFDLGGGTFDVSVLDIGDGVFEVLSISGDTHLGGDDFDQVLVNYLADEFKKQEGIDLRKDAMALQRLKDAAEKAKIELSTTMETAIILPFISADQNGPKHLQIDLTRSKFENLIGAMVEKCRKPVLDALKDAKLNPEQCDEVILVGGSTRVPMVARLVKELFNGKEPNRSVNPDEAVAIGAAIQGGIATGEVKDILVLDATPLSLGVETLGGVMTPLIRRNTIIPTSKSEVFSTASDNQNAVTINVLQGEREFAKDNRWLGTLNLTNIPPAPRGVPQIEVTLCVDVNGMLTASAKDRATGKESKIAVLSAADPLGEGTEFKVSDGKAEQSTMIMLTNEITKLTNSLGMDFVQITPGTFEMGSPGNEEGRSPDETLHNVTLTRHFFMQTTSVTQAQWKALMGDNPSHFKGDDLPVEQVSWDDAVGFCKKLGENEGRRYRLPTEAEWEYACRARMYGTDTYGGSGNLNEMGWHDENSEGKTHPVRQKHGNAWGLHDMHGNVWEWCSDYYGEYPADQNTDPRGPDQGTWRVLRGGSWNSNPRYCRSASRNRFTPGNRLNNFGFRLCLDY